MLYVALRSWRLLAISVVALFAGLAYTAAFAAADGRSFESALDHVRRAQRRARRRLRDPRAAPLPRARRGGPCGRARVVRDDARRRLLSCCSPLHDRRGFLRVHPHDFRGVAELGWIAGTGVFFGFLAATTLLPALVAQFASSLRVQSARTLLDPQIFVPFNRHPRAVLGVTAVVIVASAVALRWVSFDSNPIHLRDPRSESVKTLLELAASGDAQLLNLEAVAPDHATATEWASRLRGRPEIRNVITVDSLVPKDQDDKIAVLDDLKLADGPVVRAAREGSRGRRARRVVARCPRKASAERRDADSLHTAAAGLRASLAAASPEDAMRRSAALDRALTDGLPAELSRLASGLEARPFGRDALPEELASRYVGSNGRELVEITPAEDVSDNAAARRFIAAARSVVAKVTGPPVVYQEASNTVVRAFELAIVYAFTMVSAIIFLVLRQWRQTLLVVVPIALSKLVTAAVAVAIGMPFNYANIIALPLLVGFGVDNGIHVVHRMRTDTAEQLFDTSTMRAVLTSGLTTVASFGILAFSAHVGTASMGNMLALGLAVSVAFTLIALPAWLKRATARAGAVGVASVSAAAI